MKNVAETGTQLPKLTIGPIQPEIVSLFSLVQRDFNPIHVSAATAQTVGFDGPVVHGIYILGQFERLIRSWQPMTILSLQGRFLRPVPVGAVVVFSGRIVQRTDGAVVLRLLAKDEAGSLFAVGEAKIRITPS